MRTPEEVAREVLGNIAGPMRVIFSDPVHEELLDALDVLLAQEAQIIADVIRARETELLDAAEAAMHRGMVRGINTALNVQMDQGWHFR